MHITFKIAGLFPVDQADDGRSLDQQLKSYARHLSHEVPGADDKVGPRCRFLLKGNRITERLLNRRELVFGVKAPPDGKGGGWKGLVSWTRLDDPNHAEVRIDMSAATAAGASDWIVKFIRDIVVSCGWTIVEEPS